VIVVGLSMAVVGILMASTSGAELLAAQLVVGGLITSLGLMIAAAGWRLGRSK
jgi:hypothetical protein